MPYLPPRVVVLIDDLRRRDLLELVVQIAARRAGLVDHLGVATRTLSVSRTWQEAWWPIRHHPERCYSFFVIAALFRRHPSTIMAGIAAHARTLEQDAAPPATRPG